MANVPSVEWSGASGTKYTYWIYPRNPSIKSGELGNYIYAKVEKNVWVPVYVGQGDISVRCSQAHHKKECIDSKGATHVHMHTNANEAARLAEERDLLGGHPRAYAPSGCNEKLGG
jgi:hypothetical protein